MFATVLFADDVWLINLISTLKSNRFISLFGKIIFGYTVAHVGL